MRVRPIIPIFDAGDDVPVINNDKPPIVNIDRPANVLIPPVSLGSPKPLDLPPALTNPKPLDIKINNHTPLPTAIDLPPSSVPPALVKFPRRVIVRVDKAFVYNGKNVGVANGIVPPKFEMEKQEISFVKDKVLIAKGQSGDYFEVAGGYVRVCDVKELDGTFKTCVEPTANTTTNKPCTCPSENKNCLCDDKKHTTDKKTIKGFYKAHQGMIKLIAIILIVVVVVKVFK